MATKKDTVVKKNGGSNKLKELYMKYKEIINYIVVGGLTTLVRWGTVPLFEQVLSPMGIKDGALSFFTTLLSLVVAILFAFPPNKIFVFESKSFRGKIVLKEFVSFVAARAAASLIELVGVPLLVMAGLDYPLFGSDNLLATMLVSIVVLVANYIFSKLVVFKNRTSVKAQEKERKRLQKKALKEAKELDLEIRQPKDDNAEIKEITVTKTDKLIAVLLTVVCVLVLAVALVFLAISVFGSLFG